MNNTMLENKTISLGLSKKAINKKCQIPNLLYSFKFFLKEKIVQHCPANRVHYVCKCTQKWLNYHMSE